MQEITGCSCTQLYLQAFFHILHAALSVRLEGNADHLLILLVLLRPLGHQTCRHTWGCGHHRGSRATVGTACWGPHGGVYHFPRVCAPLSKPTAAQLSWDPQYLQPTWARGPRSVFSLGKGRQRGRNHNREGVWSCSEGLTTPTPWQRWYLDCLSHDGRGNFIPQGPHGIAGGTFGQGRKG